MGLKKQDKDDHGSLNAIVLIEPLLQTFFLSSQIEGGGGKYLDV